MGFLATASVHEVIGEPQSVRTCDLLTKVQIPEARAFFGFQIAMETIHLEVAWRRLEALVPEQLERSVFIKCAIELNLGGAKQAWLSRHLQESAPFAEHLAASCIANTVFTAGDAILRRWLHKEQLMPTYCESGDRIAADQLLHALFCSNLYGTLKGRMPDMVILEMVSTAVEIEKEYFLKIVNPHEIGLNATEVSRYLSYVANRALRMLCNSGASSDMVVHAEFVLAAENRQHCWKAPSMSPLLKWQRDFEQPTLDHPCVFSLEEGF